MAAAPKRRTRVSKRTANKAAAEVAALRGTLERWQKRNPDVADYRVTESLQAVRRASTLVGYLVEDIDPEGGAPADEPLTLSQLLAADGVTLTSVHVATGTDAEGWQHHEYRVTVAYDGRTYTQTVLHGIAVEEAPELVETVHMFVSQSYAAFDAGSYENWASDFSSDPQEWMPGKTYTDNVQMAKDLMELFGTERFEAYALADYQG